MSRRVYVITKDQLGALREEVLEVAPRTSLLMRSWGTRPGRIKSGSHARVLVLVEAVVA